jgi:hypothetical protein
MKLKPKIPFEALVLLVLIFVFVIKLMVDGFHEQNSLKIQASIPFAIAWIVFFIMVNRNYPTIIIADGIHVKGLFWGNKILSFAELSAYVLRESRRTKGGVQDHHLVVFNRKMKKVILLTKGDYPPDDWIKFMQILQDNHIQYLGTESLSEQWRRQWRNLKKSIWK